MLFLFKKIYYCSSYNDDADYAKVSFLVIASKVWAQATLTEEKQTRRPVGIRLPNLYHGLIYYQDLNMGRA